MGFSNEEGGLVLYGVSDNIKDPSLSYPFSMAIEGSRWQPSSKYAGPHEPVIRDISFDEIYDFDGPNRNVIMPVAQDIMDEISRIFGFSKAWPGIQDSVGRLAYVKGLENQR